VSARIGYKASAEQFGPVTLLDYAQHAEQIGLEIVAISDHFQPWLHTDGHSPAAIPWLAALGQRTTNALLGTSVLTPTMRYEPSVVAQAFATMGQLTPGRIFLGVGTGEALNERPATGVEMPGRKERRLRLAEAIELIRRLWTEERVDFEGSFYRTIKATVYDRPPEPLPIYVAASGPLAAKLAGRVGDGFICTSGKNPALYDELLAGVEEGASQTGRDAAGIKRMIEIKVSYDRDLDMAYKNTEFWAALALEPEQKEGIEDPIEMERVANENRDRAHTRFITSNDPEEVVEKIAVYYELGFHELVLHAPGADQTRFLDQFGEDVLPLLRERLA
jgi:coenzyme F420-dependent glucose-6-phosphate dehydrogenase